MKTITVTELLNQYGHDKLTHNKQIQFVDVRDPSEYQHEHIENALNVPLVQLGRIEAHAHSDKIAVFYCRSGNRTAMNDTLLAATPFKEKYCLVGGIVAWKEAHLAVVKQTKAPIDVMRQVQLIVSIMILLGVLLGYTVSPYFIILTVFAGLGLLVAGLTGFCGMANLLRYLPWNKPGS